MKTLLVFLIAVIFSLCTQAQSRNIIDEDVPAHVRSAFYKAHPTANEIGWKIVHTKDTVQEYIVEYTQNTFTSFALYSVDGKLVETKDKITTFAMPPSAYNYVKEQFPDATPKAYFKSIDATGIVTYSAKIKDFEIVFDKKGTYLKTIDFVL